MTKLLFREDAYLSEAEALVTGHTPEGGIILDQTVFYATAGGQPGDSGWLSFAGSEIAIANTVKAGSDIALMPAEGAALPPLGAKVVQRLDWGRRYLHMRVHSALHLLSVVFPLPVTGGAIGAGRGRLDFAMPEPPSDLAPILARLNDFVARDLPITTDWISDEELAENPSLIKTMSVKPPMGAGRVRLVRIGLGADQIDLQPCGGTHVARTGEIGAIAIEKIENKGRQNRRVSITLSE